MIQAATTQIRRLGCGVRRHGKAYLVTNEERWKAQATMGYYLFDPPIYIENPSAWGLCPQGISYIWQNGFYHACDWIGENSYPNAADILEEVFNVGWASTLLPLTDKDHIRQLVVGQSRRLLFHPRGYLANFADYRRNYIDLPQVPPCFLSQKSALYKQHVAGLDCCASLHWQVVGKKKKSSDREIERTVGDHQYPAVCQINEIPADLHLGLIAWLPIDEIQIVDNLDIPDKTDVEKALDFLIGLTSIPISIKNA